MSDDVLVERTRRELHDAIEKHFKVAFPGVISTVDWVVIAENVNEDLVHLLHPSVSTDMTGFKLRGMNYEAFKYFNAVTS